MKLAETWYPPTWRGRPNSMPWGDWQIWQRFLVSPFALFDAYAYDVMLDVGEPPANITDPAMLKMWRENTAKRIDALGKKGDTYTIIEVRDLCTWQTIGQVLGYQALYPTKFPDDSLTSPLIVCGDVTPGVEPAIAKQGITLVRVPASPLTTTNTKHLQITPTKIPPKLA